MTLFIKNMVCHRCMMAVQQILAEMSIPYTLVQLGEVQLASHVSDDTRQALDKKLQTIGFALIDDRKSRIIEKIKNTIIDLVRNASAQPGANLSDYLATQLHYEYNYLSSLFSEVEGTTIGKYFISQKIERVKELLVYDELTLSEITFTLGYSSVAHLSNQFKKVTGLTPSHFKRIGAARRKPLDEV